MSLREDIWKYEQITGESAEHVPIIKLGAFLDGYDMGVKALEQTELNPSYNSVKSELEPCDDCISRAEALRRSHIEYDDDGEGHRVVYVEGIEELPSVTPQQKWIPCSERLPEEDGLYLVIGLGIYLGEYSPFIFKREKTSPSNTLKWVQEIVAWMPLPEPYKEGEE